LQCAPEDHLLDRGGKTAGEARQGEAGRGDREQQPRTEGARQESRQLADSPAWISLRDAETIWMSRIDMNIPNTMMMKANSRFGAMRSEAGFAIMAGEAVVAFAMVWPRSA
jgi:hypothetical protein